MMEDVLPDANSTVRDAWGDNVKDVPTSSEFVRLETEDDDDDDIYRELITKRRWKATPGRGNPREINKNEKPSPGATLPNPGRFSWFWKDFHYAGSQMS